MDPKGLTSNMFVKSFIFFRDSKRSWWVKSTCAYFIFPWALFSATHFFSASQHVLLPRNTKLSIPQPIISSSCLFNLRVAPCFTEQAVYQRSHPVRESAHPCILVVINVSTLPMRKWGLLLRLSVFPLKQGLHEKVRGKRMHAGVEDRAAWKKKEKYISSCQMTLWKIPYSCIFRKQTHTREAKAMEWGSAVMEECDKSHSG